MMAHIAVEKATLSITETTIRELLRIIEEAKKNTEFIDDPYSDGDMDVEDAIEEDRKRGRILIESDHAPLRFFVSLERGINTQESLGYHLHKRLPEVKR